MLKVRERVFLTSAVVTTEAITHALKIILIVDGKAYDKNKCSNMMAPKKRQLTDNKYIPGRYKLGDRI